MDGKERTWRADGMRRTFLELCWVSGIYYYVGRERVVGINKVLMIRLSLYVGCSQGLRREFDAAQDHVRTQTP